MKLHACTTSKFTQCMMYEAYHASTLTPCPSIKRYMHISYSMEINHCVLSVSYIKRYCHASLQLYKDQRTRES